MRIKKIIMAPVLLYLFVVGMTGLLDIEFLHTGYYFPLFLFALVILDNGRMFIKQESKIYGSFVMFVGGLMLVVSSMGMLFD